MKLLTATGTGLLLSSLLALVWLYKLDPAAFTDNLFFPIELLLVLGPVALGIVSFALARVPMGRTRTRVIAAVFVVCALSVPATILYAQETSYVGCLCSGTGAPSILSTGSILVPTGTGNGTLSIQVRNQSPDGSSITSLDLTNQGLTNTTTIPNVGSVVLLYLGEPVSTANPLPLGATAAGSLQISNATAGVSYEMTIHATFPNDDSYFQTFSMTAQA